MHPTIWGVRFIYISLIIYNTYPPPHISSQGDEKYMYFDDVSIEERLEDIRQVLIERADGEEDPELQQYNEYLISSIDIIKGYIQSIEIRGELK